MSYPVMLRLEGRRVVFVGGGRETEEKVLGLVEAGAEVTLISPYEHAPLPVRWERRAYREGDLEGAWLAFCHLPDPAGHAPIFAEAERRGIWCNAVDDPPHCAFTMPSVHRQGDLVVAVSTGGLAPALAARLRQRFARELGPEYAAFLEVARELRGEIQERYATFAERRDAWYRVVDALGGDVTALREAAGLHPHPAGCGSPRGTLGRDSLGSEAGADFSPSTSSR